MGDREKQNVSAARSPCLEVVVLRLVVEDRRAPATAGGGGGELNHRPWQAEAVEGTSRTVRRGRTWRVMDGEQRSLARHGGAAPALTPRRGTAPAYHGRRRRGHARALLLCNSSGLAPVSSSSPSTASFSPASQRSGFGEFSSSHGPVWSPRPPRRLPSQRRSCLAFLLAPRPEARPANGGTRRPQTPVHPRPILF
jgi:hypothetical protein